MRASFDGRASRRVVWLWRAGREWSRGRVEIVLRR